jgi:putative ATP-binding cassette transporter
VIDLIRLLLHASRRQLLLTVAAGLVAGACSSALLAFVHQALESSARVGALALGFAALAALLFFTRAACNGLLIRLSQGAMVTLRMHLARRILATPLRQLEELGSARILAVLTDDVQAISMGIQQIPTLLINVALLVACLIYLCWLSWRLLLVLAAAIALFALIQRLTMARAFGPLRAAREEQDQLFRHMRSLVDGAKELKLHSARARDFLSVSLERTALRQRDRSTLALTLLSATEAFGLVLLFCTIGLVVFVLRGPLQLDGRTESGYAIVLIYMLGPVAWLLGVMAFLSRALVALRKTEALRDELPAPAPEAPPPGEPSSAWKRVTLAGVTHSYHADQGDRQFVLGPIDLTIQRGELIFLRGGNGSGKTTLAKLLTGLYTPEAGSVLLDDVAITDENRQWYREHFTAVFSDFQLFEQLLGVVADDLDATARRYLAKLHLDRKVEVKGGVLSTIDLSQGQRKRLALLTAYLEDRSIYVFDEWAADQDPYFRDIFYTELLPELKARGKTVFVVSHDDRYFHVADRVLRLALGQLVDGEAPEVLPKRSTGAE